MWTQTIKARLFFGMALTATISGFIFTEAAYTQNFTCVEATGNSRPVVVQNATIDGMPIGAGDEIAVFDDTLCVGSVVFSGTFNATITVWMEVALPGGTILPGAKNGNPMTFKIWQQSSNSQLMGSPAYSVGTGTLGEPLTVVSLLVQPVSVEVEVETKSDLRYHLNQNYPNPFNSQTRISFEIPAAVPVVLKIYNSLGQEIKTLVNEFMAVGYHSMVWDGRDIRGEIVPSSMYYYEIMAGDFVETRRMTFLK